MTTMGMDDMNVDFDDYEDAEYDDRWDDGEDLWDDDVAEDLFDDDVAEDLFDDGDGEDYDGEARSARSRQRRLRQRRLARARRLRAQAGRRPTRARPVPGRTTSGPARVPSRYPAGRTVARTSSVSATPVVPKQAVAAIRNLDIDARIQEDNLRRALAAQNKRMARSNYVAVASTAVNQAIESFDAPDNPYARAAARFVPLLLLSPRRSGTGLEAFAKDPRVIGGAAVLGITVVGEGRKRVTVARNVAIAAPSELSQGEQGMLVADVLDGRGKVLQRPVTWESNNPSIATVDSDGKVTALTSGNVLISAKADGAVSRTWLRVTPKPGAAAGK